MSGLERKLYEKYKRQIKYLGGNVIGDGLRKKKRVVKRRGGELVGDGRMRKRAPMKRKAKRGGTRAGTLAGAMGRKKPNAWIMHVKAFVRKHGCSYSDGMKLARASYRPVNR
jgi:hypothetical protein